jgi:hypothetical protein
MLSHFAGRVRAQGSAESLGGGGMLFAAGMIAGESLTGVILAVPIVASGRADVMALPASLRLGDASATLLGLAMFALLVVWLYRVASRNSTTR